jgi:hypothetical protein
MYNSLPWIVKSGKLGFSITQAFSEGQDITYGATLSTVKASMSLYNENENNKIYKIPFFFVFPVIVIDAPLFECYLDRDNRVSIQEINEGVFYFDVKIEDYSGICIRVVTERALDVFIKDIRETSDFILLNLKEEIEVEWVNWQKRVNDYELTQSNENIEEN